MHAESWWTPSPVDMLQVMDSPSDSGEISLGQCLELCWASVCGLTCSPDSQLGPGTPGDCSFSLYSLSSLRLLPSFRLPRLQRSSLFPVYLAQRGNCFLTRVRSLYFFRRQTGLAPAGPPDRRASGSIPCSSVSCLSGSWAPLGPKLGCPCSAGLQWGSLLWFLLLCSHLLPLCTYILLQLGLTASLLWPSFGSLFFTQPFLFIVESPVHHLSHFYVFFPHKLQA